MQTAEPPGDDVLGCRLPGTLRYWSSVVDLVAKPGFGYLLKDRVLEVDEFIGAV